MNALMQVQLDFYGLLLAAPYFQDIGIFLFRPRAAGGLVAVQSEIDRHLAGLVGRGGKTGLAVIVLMPTGNTVDPNVPGPRLSFIHQIRVIERPLVNMSADRGTLKPAEEVCLEVLQLGHHRKFNRSFTLVAAAQAMVPTDEGGTERVIYDCRFEQLTGLTQSAKAARPVIAPAGGAILGSTDITLTTATPGANLLYSIDGSYPTLPYTVPVTIAAPLTFRAVSAKADLQQSDVAEVEFT